MRRVLALVVLAVLLALAAPAGAYHGPRVTSPTEAPYTVLIEVDLSDGFLICTGSIIDPTHVLTAAHCTQGESGRRLRVASYTVTAGVTKRAAAPTPDAQERRVVAVRVHPGFSYERFGFGDVAVLQVDAPFETTAAVAPIALAELNLPPAEGAIVRGYGFGEDHHRDPVVDAHLLDMTVGPALRCLSGISALICASSRIGTGCPGDSGGPIVTTGPLVVLTGVISGGSDNRCTKGERAWFSDLTSPGIGEFVRGNDHPPAMPYAEDIGDLRLPRRNGGGFTCKAPTWVDAESTTTLFLRDGRTVAQDGPSSAYVPQLADLGHRISCRSIAHSAGGTAQVPGYGTATVGTGPPGGFRLCLRRPGTRQQCRGWTLR